METNGIQLPKHDQSTNENGRLCDNEQAILPTFDGKIHLKNLHILLIVKHRHTLHHRYRLLQDLREKHIDRECQNVDSGIHHRANGQKPKQETPFGHIAVFII